MDKEQIDELSKDTLKSYVNKASDVAKSNYRWKGGFLVNKVSSHKAKKRKEGVLNATDRIMQREGTQIDELSKDTLKSYINKADARTMDRTIDNPKAHKKAQNRTFGIEKAVKKIQEDGAVNAAGAGNVAGLGVGPQGEPGVKSSRVLKRFKKFIASK